MPELLSKWSGSTYLQSSSKLRMLRYMLVLTQTGYPEHHERIKGLLGNCTWLWYATCKIPQLAFSNRNLIMAKGLPSQPVVAYSFCVRSIRKHWR